MPRRKDRDHTGKVAVITGGAGGIGSAIARYLGERGAHLALLDLDQARLSAVVNDLQSAGATASGFPCDLSNHEASSDAVEQVVAQLGGVDMLFCNAGISHRSAAAASDPVVFERVMAINYFGSVYTALAALPHLSSRHGDIVVTSSIAGFVPVLGRAGYCASKYALHGFFETLGAELEGQVAVHLVCPGFTETGIATHALDQAGEMTELPRVELWAAADPATVAARIVAATRARRRVVVLTKLGRISRWVHRFAPIYYERGMRRRLEAEIR